MKIDNLFTRAKNWLNSSNPDLAQIASAYRGMLKRINTGNVEVVDDAEAALDLLAETYDNRGGDVSILLATQEPPQTEIAPEKPQSGPQLDASPLVPIDTAPRKELSEDERRNILADLKRTLRSPSQGKYPNAPA
ncbi:hypothetical protein QAO71_17870 (plasmid) [Halopseudomonas sp. SMJS2]|uniref:hypothetical protein n=1 Tax=Halopseudomonas sp. SMJS2 TaxID=3041098 RepID=UPI002452C3C0|nr:hypothetical protein [Halopseudomonas sp. SMJS2]WGK63410.1 hypothetical protein QAO71_17870 [Halopseudomonas sp. SMJS2]